MTTTFRQKSQIPDLWQIKGLDPSGRSPRCADHNPAVLQWHKSPWEVPTGEKKCTAASVRIPAHPPHSRCLFSIGFGWKLVLKNHSSFLMESPLIFPTSIFQDCNSSSHTQHRCFPKFPPYLSEHLWGNIPRKRHADRTGQSPIFLGSYLNNSCTGEKKQKNQQISLSWTSYLLPRRWEK